jgi:iron complex outermembrane receptor protein
MAIRYLIIATVSAGALFAGTAQAQQTAQADNAATQPPTNAPPSGGAQPAPTDTGEGSNIVVTGFRRSIAASIRAKRNSAVIADILTAEDIGKFPDKNVAEALQRIPGVVINREFGEGERVSVRGTATNLTKTLLNGHNVATADWFILDQLAATRAFNYLTLPSEVVGELEVYKSPEADIEEGGVGATVNVHTRNPLDLKPLTISASAQAVYSERSKKWDPQLSGLISWKNSSNTFGVLAALVYEKRRIRRDGVEVLGYFTQADNPATPANEDVSNGALMPSLIGSALFQQERQRYGGNVAVQFKPSDALEINLTGLYTRFNANNFNQNFLAWGSNAIGGGGTLTNPTVVDGTVVAGTITSTPGGRAVVYDAIDRLAYSQVWSGDFDTIWRPGVLSTVHLKAGYTEAHGNTKAQPFYEGGAPASFTFDLRGRTPQVSFSGIDPTNPNDLAFDFASLHKITNSDKEKYAYLDFEQQVQLGPIHALKFGAKFTDHDRVTTFLATTYGGFFLPLASSGCDGGPCLSADFADGQTPSDFLENIALPGTLTNYWQVDRNALEQIMFGLPASVRARIINPPENYSINEKTFGGYAMAKFGGDNWRGNIGVRVIRTDQTSKGNVVGTGGPGSINNAFGSFSPVTVDRSYTDVLPSANLSFDLDPKLVLRFAAARTMARPDYTDIVPRVSLNPGSLSGSGGDPSVNPFRANQFDTSLEWYPDRETIVAAALYYKDIQSYIVNRTDQEVFPIETTTPNLSRCTLAGGSNPNLWNCLFDINRRSNGPGGSNKGFELQVSHPIWGGFGVIANYTFSDAKSQSGDPIPGNSKHSLNLTGYYEKGPISARLSYTYRSKFFIDIDRASPLNQAATSSLDASASYKLTDNVSLTADAVNLTNVKIVQYSGSPVRPRAIYDNGRQFYFGARFRY